MPDKQQPWFVDFQDVWLAYNEELLRQNHFAVEAIDLARPGPSTCRIPSNSAQEPTSAAASNPLGDLSLGIA